jgi:outer membrane lipoprotein-sorting protein
MKTLRLSILALAITTTVFSAKAQSADETLKKKATCSPAKTESADAVIQKHIDAVGGSKNWDKIKTVKLTGGINQGGMEITMVQTIANNKGMRLDISAMGQNGYMIVTPNEGWMYMPFAGQTKPEPIPADQLKIQKGNLDFKSNQLVDKSLIAKSSMDGMDTINSIPCYKLKVTGNDGNDQVCYIDAKTYYLVRTEVKIQDQEMSITYSDFKKQPEGIIFPMTMATAQGDIKYKSIEINKPIDDKVFTKPADAGK